MSSNLFLPIAIFSAEMFLNLLNIPVSILNIHLILTTKMIHRNLRFILLCQTADFLLRGLIKLLCTLPARIFTNNIFWYESDIFALQFFFFATITFRMLLGHVIVLERLLATIYASCYENYWGNTFSLVWFPIIFVVLWNSFSQMEALMQNKQAMSNKSTMVTLGTFYAATLLSFIEIGVFTLLWRYNKRKFANYRRRVSLGERYQLLENTRTTLQLVPCLALYFLLQLNASFSQSLFQFQFFDTYWNNIGLFAVNFVTTFLHLLTEISVILFHPILNNRARHICMNFVGIGRNHRQVVPWGGDVVTIVEALDKEKETEKHFELLKQFWK